MQGLEDLGRRAVVHAEEGLAGLMVGRRPHPRRDDGGRPSRGAKAIGVQLAGRVPSRGHATLGRDVGGVGTDPLPWRAVQMGALDVLKRANREEAAGG